MSNLTDNVSVKVLAGLDDETRRMVDKLCINVDTLIAEYLSCLEESSNRHVPAMRSLHKRTGASVGTRGVYNSIVLAYRKLEQ